MPEQNENELDFNSDDYNGFYYTNEKQIKKMDDSFIISKIIEKYPDFSDKNSENLLKQVFMIVVKDTKFINEITKKYDITVQELFGLIYRNYSFLFGACFITKLQKLVSRRSYARASKTIRRKKSKRIGRPSRKRACAKGKARTRKSIQVPVPRKQPSRKV